MSGERSSGFFISFEGSEGCGKSTQIGLLDRALRGAGLDPLSVREPGGTPIGEAIRHLLQHAPEGDIMVPEAELLLFAASRAQLVREVIHPALEAGRIVIADRFLDSTAVYQGIARKIPGETVAGINHFAAGSRLPDVTFLLDMDEAVALARLPQRNGGAPYDRMESQSGDFYRAVREGYLALARQHPGRIHTLDAARPPDELAAAICNHLKTLNHGLFQGICA